VHPDLIITFKTDDDGIVPSSALVARTEDLHNGVIVHHSPLSSTAYEQVKAIVHQEVLGDTGAEATLEPTCSIALRCGRILDVRRVVWMRPENAAQQKILPNGLLVEGSLLNGQVSKIPLSPTNATMNGKNAAIHHAR